MNSRTDRARETRKTNRNIAATAAVRKMIREDWFNVSIQHRVREAVFFAVTLLNVLHSRVRIVKKGIGMYALFLVSNKRYWL